MVVEALGLMIGGVALVDPAIRACFTAYEKYKLTEEFGSDYMKVFRSLGGQAARLETLSNMGLLLLVEIPPADGQTETTIKTELAAMKTNFELCHGLLRKYGDSCELAVV